MPSDLTLDLSALTPLQQSSVKDYFSQPIPSGADKKVIGLLKAVNEDPSKRQFLDRALTDEHSFGLLAFAERMATLAVRIGCSEKILWGLLAVVVEGFRFDARENIMVLALLHDSACRIGFDPLPLFRLAVKHAQPEVAKTVLDFATGPQQERSIESMGYTVFGEGADFRYVREW